MIFKKPVDPARLLETLHETIERARAERGRAPAPPA